MRHYNKPRKNTAFCNFYAPSVTSRIILTNRIASKKPLTCNPFDYTVKQLFEYIALVACGAFASVNDQNLGNPYSGMGFRGKQR
jgi:hypothetical protein